jgi:hypothetical protein
MDEGMFVADFMRKVIDLLNQLARFDETLSSSFVVEKIFNSLPKSYDSFVRVDYSEN